MGSEGVVERPRRVRLREVDLREVDLAPREVRVRSEQEPSLRWDLDDGPVRPLESIKAPQRGDGASDEVHRIQKPLRYDNRILDR